MKKLTRRKFLKKLFFFITGLAGFGAILNYSLKKVGLFSIRDKEVLKNATISFYEARFYKRLSGDNVECNLCFRNCIVPEGKRGFCRNRENRAGKYYTLVYDKPCAMHVDPIEKEPIYHMLPGGTIFCISTASCNSRCKFCQNWHISQRSIEETTNYKKTPADIVSLAKKYHCDGISFTYGEPTVFYEYMYDIAKLAKKANLKVACHSNGLINQEPLLALLEYLDAVTVDLKAFNPEYYQQVCSTDLGTVLNTLKVIKKTGVHLEIVNLILPTLNDNMNDIKNMCMWINNNLGKDVPLHFSRFFPAYQLKNLPPTPIQTLESAWRLAEEAGLHYVSIGNVPGHKYNSTFCPVCKKRIIHRAHFKVYENNLLNGKCKFCGHKVPGIWA